MGIQVGLVSLLVVSRKEKTFGSSCVLSMIEGMLAWEFNAQRVMIMCDV